MRPCKSCLLAARWQEPQLLPCPSRLQARPGQAAMQQHHHEGHQHPHPPPPIPWSCAAPPPPPPPPPAAALRTASPSLTATLPSLAHTHQPKQANDAKQLATSPALQPV